MFLKYPYTDMYAANLDWMIQAIREVQEIIENLGHVVNTFNTRDGDVELLPGDVNGLNINILSKLTASTRIEDLTQQQLNSMYGNGTRVIMGMNTHGRYDRLYVLFRTSGSDNVTYVEFNEVTDNTVTSFNGQTGDVDGVSSYNGQTGPVTGVSSFNGQSGSVTGVSSVNGATGEVGISAENIPYDADIPGTSIADKLTSELDALSDELYAAIAPIESMVFPEDGQPGSFMQLDNEGRPIWGGSPYIVIDPTLSVQGEAADAKATGNGLTDLKSFIDGAVEIFPNLFGGVVVTSLGGITITSDDNEGTITLNGTSTDYVKIPFMGKSVITDCILEAGTYTGKAVVLSGSTTNGNGWSLRYDVSDSGIGSGWVNNGNWEITKIFDDSKVVGLVIIPDVSFTNWKLKLQIEKGNSVSSDPRYGYTAKDDIARSSIPNINSGFLYDKYTNNFDKTEFEAGYISSNGSIVSDSSTSTSGYIYIKNMSNISFMVADTDNRTIAFYDSNKNYIAGTFKTVNTPDITNPITVNIPVIASYIRITFKNSENTEQYTIVKRNQTNKNISRKSFSSFWKFGVVGDSLSVGYIGSGTYEQNVRNIKYSWGQNMARNIGNICLNFGRSGATTETWMTYPECYQTLATAENLCQCYIIGIGTNDVISGDLGSISDINPSDYTQNANTFYGRFAAIIQAIRAFASDAKIFVLTIPYPRIDPDKNTAIRDICGLSSINTNVFLVDIERFYSEYFTDTLLTSEYFSDHFSAPGYAKIAEILQIAISDVMNMNPTSFRNINILPYGNNDVIN